MRGRVAFGVALLMACGLSIGVAEAAATHTTASGTYTLCAAGAGKPVVSPKKSGHCGSGRKAIVLARSGTLASLTSQLQNLKSQDQSLAGRVTTLESKVATLQASTVPAQVAQLSTEVTSLESLLAGVSRDGNTLRFSGMNVQLVSGSGSTDGPVNGLGNLIIGYNENPGTQTGSHNLVLGKNQTFTSYAGIVAGANNTLSGPFADVFGNGNTASNLYASVLGGTDNTASGAASSVLGGDSVSLGTLAGTAPAGIVGSETGSVGFTLGANACGGFTIGDSALKLGDVPLFAYTSTPPTQPVLFTPGAVTTAGQAKFTACNNSSSGVSFSGSLHIVAFRG